ncbi:MAG: phosphatidylserine decarboxylase [Roseiflexaceae bacterium]
MPEQRISTSRKARFPGLDAEATPVIGLGLGLTGLILGLRPRLAPVSLALTAAAALLYRDPERATPTETESIFAPADGLVIGVEDLYEHRFLHTDAVRLTIAVSLFDVAVHRSPASGVVAYLEHIPSAYRPAWDVRSADQGERQYIGIKTAWGPLLVAIVAGPLGRRLDCQVGLGDLLRAGARLSKARFGSRVELLLPRDAAEGLPELGDRLRAGMTRIGHVVPL